MKRIPDLKSQLRLRPLGLVVSLAASILTGCSGGDHDGLTRYPVQGTVTINGKPAADLIVRFISKHKSPEGANASFPVGMTDEDGVFRISTNGDADGAVAGDYDVTIVWPESNEPPLRDRLGGAYATPEKSQLQVTITATENVVGPFALQPPRGLLNTSKPTREEDD